MPNTNTPLRSLPGQADEPPEWTVIGLLDMDGNLTVAGVAADDIQMHDSEYGEDNAQRWAQSFTAPSAHDAEVLAVAYCAIEYGPDDEAFRPGDRVQHILDAAHDRQTTGIVDVIHDDEAGTVRVDWPTGPEDHAPGELIQA